MTPTLKLLGLAAVLALLAAVPFVGSNYTLRLATFAAMYVALASSWNVIGGMAGYPSFATASFFGLGAYGAGVMMVKTGAPLPLAWLSGGLIAGVFALFIGPAILRLRGHYFAVASLVTAVVLREVINSATTITGGGMGLNLPPRTTDVTLLAQQYYGVMVGLAVVAVLTGVLVSRAKIGWALRCIEQNEDAAVVLGVDTLYYKTVAFVISGLLAGLAGALYATWIGYIDPTDVFEELLSVKPIVMVLIGGVGTLYAPVVGALCFLALEELVWRNILNFHAGVLGLLIVALLVFLPGGLKDLGGRLARLAPWRSAPR
jgi:branched-chain amino acid transport system permease protein